MICSTCKGRGKVPDFDCYHGRPEHEPVQCDSCKGTGQVPSQPVRKSKEEYLRIAASILGQEKT